MFGLIVVMSSLVILFAHGQSQGVSCGGVTMSPDQECVSYAHGEETGASSYDERANTQDVMYRLGPWGLAGGILLLTASVVVQVRERGRRQ